MDIYDHMTGPEMLSLYEKLAMRSETTGFSADRVGLSEHFENARQKFLRFVAEAAPAPTVPAPFNALTRPFPPEADDSAYSLEDGYIYRRAGSG